MGLSLSKLGQKELRVLLLGLDSGINYVIMTSSAIMLDDVIIRVIHAF